MTTTYVNPNAGPYPADGVNRNWAYTFRCEALSHMQVTVVNALGVESSPIDPSLYQMTGLDTNGGGNVVYPISPVAPLAIGNTVKLKRVTPYDQPTLLKNQSKYLPEDVERAFDHGSLGAQQLHSRLTSVESILAGLLALGTAPPGTTPASAVSVVPNSDLVSVTAQAALVELQAEILTKAALSHTHAQSDITNLVSDLAAKIAISTLSAKGDILCRNATVPARRSVGVDGKFLKALSSDPTGLTWGDGGVADIQTFVASGTWTKPSNLGANALVRVRLWGGGGGGSRDASIAQAPGGGGGGFHEQWFLASALTATVAMTIGAGGAAAAGASTNGNDGGATSFGAYFLAGGGAGGRRGVSKVGGGGGGPLGSAAASVPGSPLMGQGFGDLAASSTNMHGGFWHGGGGGANTDGAGDSVFGGGGGFGGAANGTGGVSQWAGNGGNTVANVGTAGNFPSGGGGGGIGGAGAGAAGYAEVVVFG